MDEVSLVVGLAAIKFIVFVHCARALRPAIEHFMDQSGHLGTANICI